ncbi:MAG: NifB/NifX family molybdenum-iron cluster-binding protein, partial [Candidatus Muiribacteriota bacterium]
RAKGFIFYNTENENVEYHENTQIVNIPQGAGVQSGKLLVDNNVNVLITGHVGPNAFNVLKRADIKIYSAKAGTVQEALKNFVEKNLEELTGADKQGHWM